jgi:hypothetical protein
MNKVFYSLLIFMVGCASPPSNYIPQVSQYKFPEVNKEVKAGLGEVLLDQGLAVQQDIISVLEEVSWGFIGVKIPKGSYVKTGEDKKYHYFHNVSLDNKYVAAMSIPFVYAPAVTSNILVRKVDQQLCWTDVAVHITCDKNERFKLGKETIVNKDSYRQTLLYSGKVGNKLRMSFREFNMNMARQAYSVDVEYDLNDGNVIGYKGAKLEVLSASNTEIKYKVLKNFN